MIYKPHKKPENFDLLIFVMDNMIYLLLGGLIAFVSPLFLSVLISSRHSRETQPADVVIQHLYDNHTGQVYQFEIVCVVIASAFVLSMIFYKLFKYHLIEIETTDDKLVLKYQNLLKNQRSFTCILTGKEFLLKYRKPSQDSDQLFDISTTQPYKRILSTDKSKYWHHQNDRQVILALLRELKKKGKLNAVFVNDKNNAETTALILSMFNI